MPSLVTDNFRVFAAEQFIESLEEPYSSVDVPNADDTSSVAQAYRSKIYLFIGRSYNWRDTTSGAVVEKYSGSSTVTDFSPPEPVDSYDELNEIYDDMIAIKRVTRSDVSQVIRKRVWQNNTVYDMYRNNYSTSNLSATGQSKLFDSQFYVMNSSYQVYKCIYNGQSPTYPNGKPSTVEPTGTSTAIIDSPTDGYRWKYMYTLSIADYIKFVSTDFIPVKSDSTVISAAVNGAINQVVISNRGSGLTAGTYYTPVIGDGGLGADATKAIIKIVVPSSGTNANKIDTVEIQTAGSDYTFGKITLTECYSSINNALSRSGTVTNLSAGSSSIEVIISPPGGHGSDVTRELGAYRVMINKSLDFLDGSGDIPVDMQFRRFGLISDPQTSSNADFVTTTAAVCKCIKFSSGSVGDFTNGEIITQNSTGAKGRVIHWDSTTKILRYYQNEYISATQSNSNANKLVAFSGANAIVGNISTTSLTPDTGVASTTISGITFTNGYADAEIKKFSGQILYVENRKPVFRSNDQIEDVKLVVEF
jgi:hypothetical protein